MQENITLEEFIDNLRQLNVIPEAKVIFKVEWVDWYCTHPEITETFFDEDTYEWEEPNGVEITLNYK